MMDNIPAARVALLPLLIFLALSRPALISAQESAPPAGSEIPPNPGPYPILANKT